MSRSSLDPDPEAPAADPFTALAGWIPQGDGPRGLMTLCTIDEDGLPDARALVLSSYDARGLCFHTDSRSAKTAQLTAAPVAAASFTWPERSRHLVIRGAVEPLPAREAAEAYHEREERLRLLAWLNTEEFARLPGTVRRARWAELAERPEAIADPPAEWAGYRLIPTTVTFWQGGTGAGSIRVRYARSPGDRGWAITVLPG